MFLKLTWVRDYGGDHRMGSFSENAKCYRGGISLWATCDRQFPCIYPIKSLTVQIWYVPIALSSFCTVSFPSIPYLFLPSISLCTSYEYYESKFVLNKIHLDTLIWDIDVWSEYKIRTWLRKYLVLISIDAVVPRNSFRSQENHYQHSMKTLFHVSQDIFSRGQCTRYLRDSVEDHPFSIKWWKFRKICLGISHFSSKPQFTG